MLSKLSSGHVSLYDANCPLTPQTLSLNESHRLHGAGFAKVVHQQLFYSVLLPHKTILACEGYCVAEIMPTLNRAVKPLVKCLQVKQ